MSTDNAVSLNDTATTWPEVLTLEEAVAFLKVSVEALRDAIQQNEVPGMRFGGELRFSREALIERLRRPLNNNDNKLTMTAEETHDRIRSLIGVWKDDPTIDGMIDQMDRVRKRQLKGGLKGVKHAGS